jgi:hypothetical protein
VSRFTIPIFVLALAASPCIAQSQNLLTPIRPVSASPPAQLPAAVIDNRIHFASDSLAVKQNGPRWQIWSGNTLVKDFGENRENAYEARRLIAEMKLTERATIGTPETVMEYWLANGEAPHPPMSTRHIVPFDSGSLKIDKMNENYVVRDARRILYNFGTNAGDANQALAVLQKYHFNELGVIGTPVPSMTYLVHSEKTRLGFGTTDAMFQTKLLPQQTPGYPLILPGLGTVGERTPFDPMRLDIAKTADGWHLVAGPHDLARLGTSDYTAREALHTLQRYPMNEYVRIGTSGFGFYLSRSQTPHGVPLGFHHTDFDPKSLAVRPEGDRLAIGDGRHVLATFPMNEENEAKMAVAVVKYYGFDSQCEAGGLKFLVKDR